MTSLTVLAIALCLVVLPTYGSWAPQYPYINAGGQTGGRAADGNRPFFQPRTRGNDGFPRQPIRKPFTSQQKAAPVKRLPVPETFVNPQDAVAFSGVRTTDQFFYKEGPVLFDNVITNLNGGYNPEYGVFTAPVPGIYVINYHVTSKGGSPKPAHVDLVRNNQVINSAKSIGDCITASNSASLYLNQFDTVKVTGRMATTIGCSVTDSCTFSVTLVNMGKFTDLKIPRAFPMDKW